MDSAEILRTGVICSAFILDLKEQSTEWATTVTCFLFYLPTHFIYFKDIYCYCLNMAFKV